MYVITKGITKDMVIIINPFITLDIPIAPDKPKTAMILFCGTYKVTCIIPANNPAIPAPIDANIAGFLSFNVTP